jgi:hypothetical protein
MTGDTGKDQRRFPLVSRVVQAVVKTHSSIKTLGQIEGAHVSAHEP